jgi:hypothetical protein
MDTLLQVTFLVVLVERVVAAFVTPIFDKFKWDKFILIYIAWLLGALLVFGANINLLEKLIPTLPPIIGQILSAIVAGGGANLLHDVFDPETKKKTA